MPRFVKCVFAFCAICLIANIAVACPSCKEALSANDPERATLVRGYFWSILFMLSMPFTLLTSFGVYMYLLVKKSRRQAAEAEFQPDSPPSVTREDELVGAER